MRPFRLVVMAVVTVIALLLAVLGIAYLSDYTVEATVVDKECFGTLSGQENTVTVRTKALAIDYTLSGIPDRQCALVNEGNHVQYRLRSSRTTLWQSEGGACIYDSVDGVGGCPA